MKEYNFIKYLFMVKESSHPKVVVVMINMNSIPSQ